MGKLIYIVDDEQHIRQLVALGLRDAGFETRAFADGASFLAAMAKQKPDAVILDWMMPPPDGAALCAMLRADPDTRAIPIAMLTARAGEADLVAGLDNGADDYITKPFSVKELAARIRALLRREELMAKPNPAPNAVIALGEIVLDPVGRIVKKSGMPVNLTMREFDLLSMLMKNAGRVMTREMLLDLVWGMEYYGDTRTVDVHVRYLRQKLEDVAEHPRYIQTVRGVGYRFTDDGEGEAE